MSPEPTAIRDALERVLASQAFATAGRHSRLLRYLVERTLAGEGEQLKEYVLGTEVFDRSGAYDPRLDSIVRVEVRRLRTRLEDYYSNGGATDPVVISIPRGSYVPLFSSRQNTVTAAEIAGPAPTGEQRRYSALALITATVIVSIVVIVSSLAIDSDRAPAAQASSRVGIAVLPFEHYSTREQDEMIAAHLTDAVTTELARLGTVSVASRTTASQYTGNVRRVPEIAKALDVNFIIESSAVVTGDHLRVTARLVDGVLDRKVWVGEYDLTPAEIPEVARRMAAEASAAALSRARVAP